MNGTCPKCGGTMQVGVATAEGLMAGWMAEEEQARLIFVTLGNVTSKNPIKAYKQGLADEPANQCFRIRGERCANCGYLELFATDRL